MKVVSILSLAVLVLSISLTINVYYDHQRDIEYQEIHKTILENERMLNTGMNYTLTNHMSLQEDVTDHLRWHVKEMK